ncbi:MAG: hydrogen peroxide-inducible genes activator [Kordiimonadaceae bacterium]|nr:hydrogen peroxide-inducible genes activator [Kordiimonadaceae bacterium]MBO6567984.1 hydrogen peroxide-inducible genes activator [Kordiimonadaceae bacterium]MBO6964286.1 hydrogen peroxide-inducible genes activator [Kordiimonadaceae bacterium]
MEVNKLTLRQLRYLVALEDAGHFRHAAEACNISQPSLSAQIQLLEEILGVQLVERDRSGVTLSPVGREVSLRARTVLDELQSIVDFTAGAQHGLVGTIRLGAKTTLGPYLLPHVVAKLHKNHPELSLYVRDASPQQLVYELTRGLHDVVLAQLPVTGAELVTSRLFREPLFLALAVDHPLAEKDEVDVDDLSGLQVLSLSPQYHLHDQINTLCKEFGATRLRDYEGTSLDALRHMVGMGMGVTFLPALYAQSEISPQSEIVVKKLKGRTVTRSVGLVWRKSAGRAPAYHQLADVIREVVKESFPTVVVES